MPSEEFPDKCVVFYVCACVCALFRGSVEIQVSLVLLVHQARR